MQFVGIRCSGSRPITLEVGSYMVRNLSAKLVVFTTLLLLAAYLPRCFAGGGAGAGASGGGDDGSGEEWLTYYITK